MQYTKMTLFNTHLAINEYLDDCIKQSDQYFLSCSIEDDYFGEKHLTAKKYLRNLEISIPENYTQILEQYEEIISLINIYAINMKRWIKNGELIDQKNPIKLIPKINEKLNHIYQYRLDNNLTITTPPFDKEPSIFELLMFLKTYEMLFPIPLTGIAKHIKIEEKILYKKLNTLTQFNYIKTIKTEFNNATGSLKFIITEKGADYTEKN